jgi:hypothetical protein
METLDELKMAGEIKRRECKISAQAYHKTLTALKPANFVLVVGAALLSLAAGASILTENHLITPFHAGIMALISGAFTIIHSKLGCDEYQGACRKLQSFYLGMAQDYANLQFISDLEEYRARFIALNDQISVKTKKTKALPYDWAIASATRSIG